MHLQLDVPAGHATRHAGTWRSPGRRDRLVDRTSGRSTLTASRARAVAYLSAEFLIGPQLGNNLLELGIEDAAARPWPSFGHDLDALLEQEEEPGLGNGGLGRLAACYLDSLATLRIPAIGYGIRYEFGIFDQADPRRLAGRDHRQVAAPGQPLGDPAARSRVRVGFGGRTELARRQGATACAGFPRASRASPTTRRSRLPRRHRQPAAPVAGRGARVVRLPGLQRRRLLRGGGREGDSETITKVLYPNDEPEAGKQLRLEQQYFFVSCSLQDMIRIHLRGPTLHGLRREYAIQLNDTHPAIAVAELMRLLVDEHGLDWDKAWDITSAPAATPTTRCCPRRSRPGRCELFGALLPRHLEIIYEINRRFLDDVRRRVAGRRRARAAAVADRRARRALRAHGEPRLRGQPRHQRRRRAAHASC